MFGLSGKPVGSVRWCEKTGQFFKVITDTHSSKLDWKRIPRRDQTKEQRLEIILWTFGDSKGWYMATQHKMSGFLGHRVGDRWRVGRTDQVYELIQDKDTAALRWMKLPRQKHSLTDIDESSKTNTFVKIIPSSKKFEHL